jgi:transposase
MRGRWQRAEAGRADGAWPGTGRLSPEPEELHRLREEQTRFRMARELFTKAAAFFAHESSGGMPVWRRPRRGGRFPCWVR